MKYTYNEERDRLARKAWDPHFMRVIYEETETGEQRAGMLYTCTNLNRHMRTIAQSYANAGEIVKDVQKISRAKYESWLCEEDVVKIGNESIPARYVTDFLIAEDTPQNGRYGDLSTKRMLLIDRDANLLSDLLHSWEKAGAQNDIVREEDEPEYIPNVYDDKD